MYLIQVQSGREYSHRPILVATKTLLSSGVINEFPLPSVLIRLGENTLMNFHPEPIVPFRRPRICRVKNGKVPPPEELSFLSFNLISKSLFLLKLVSGHPVSILVSNQYQILIRSPALESQAFETCKLTSLLVASS